jgi:hypothetical protein
MAITISPLYPVVDEDITFTSSTATGTHQVIAITSVPSASETELGIVTALADDFQYSALVAVEGQSQADTAALDVPGEYGIALYDISELPGIRSTDNSGSQRRFVINGSDTGIVHVGAIVDLPIRTITGRGATLRLQINDTTVRVASLVDPTDEGARVLALTAAPVAGVAALVGLNPAVMGNDLVTGTNDLLAKYEAHRATAAAVHTVADTTNVANRTAATSLAGAINVLNQLRTVITAHQQVVPAAGAWHPVADFKNVVLAAPANDMRSATALLADLRERVYELHRVQVAAPACHIGADAANALTGVTQLDTAICAYLDALVTVNPPVLAGEPEGAHDAAANFGFAIQDS